MVPSFVPGDHVLTFNWFTPKVGQVIIYKKNSTYFIKRVVKCVDNNVYISGDNKEKSINLGPIKKSEIVGKVLFSY